MSKIDRNLKVFRSLNVNLKGIQSLNFYKFTQIYPKKER